MIVALKVELSTDNTVLYYYICIYSAPIYKSALNNGQDEFPSNDFNQFYSFNIVFVKARIIDLLSVP